MTYQDWEETAKALDAAYRDAPKIARAQLKNQPVLLVLDDTEHRFFPVRRLVDGQDGRDMTLRKSSAQEVQRYRADLEGSGFCEIVETSFLHQELLEDLSSFLRSRFNTSPSPSTKTFWVVNSPLRQSVLSAFDRFDKEGPPDGFGKARTWFVAHPDTGVAYPAKVIFGLATGQGANRHTLRARDALRRAGFEVANLSDDLPSPPDNLTEGSTRQVTRNLRERNPVARKLCIEHYLRRDGRLDCVACDFDFAATYGDLGNGFIHVHHVDPLAEAQGTRSVSPEFDLVPVCPNCHAMIHRGGQNRSIAEIRKLLGKAE